MKTLQGTANYWGKRRAVFKVTTNLRDVYMSVGRDDIHAVVEVDAQRFLDLWRSPDSSHPDVAEQTPDTWPSDYKFAQAEEGFGEGEFNPVPLALVHCWRGKQGGRDGLSFTDGVTRTIWLLTAGARVFPVSCSLADAPHLQALAGAEETQYRTTAELLPDPSTEQHFAEIAADEERQRERLASEGWSPNF
jgi:hypothetical protein